MVLQIHFGPFVLFFLGALVDEVGSNLTLGRKRGGLGRKSITSPFLFSGLSPKKPFGEHIMW